MEYIKNEDYQYIKNKYNKERWLRQDNNFKENTGKNGDKIKLDLATLEEQNKNLHHFIRTAMAFAYVLENTRIACDPRDKFPSINAIDRPVFDTIALKREYEVHKILKKEQKLKDALHDSGAMTFWLDYSHSVPVWERIFKLGFSGLLAESEKARSSMNCNEEQTAFFDSVKITYEAIIKFIKRLKNQAVYEGSMRMASALEHIEKNPPATFYQALLVDYLYFMLSEHINGMQARSLSNFDKCFYPFYQHDLENGVSEEEIREDLAYFLMQFTAINNYFNQPVYLGGCKENEDTIINDLSYLFLDVYDKMGIFNPKIQIKVAKQYGFRERSNNSKSTRKFRG